MYYKAQVHVAVYIAVTMVTIQNSGPWVVKNSRLKSDM